MSVRAESNRNPVDAISTDALVDALESTSAARRRDAAIALCDRAERESDVPDKVTTRLAARDRDVRVLVCQLVAEMPAPTRSAPLARALRDLDPTVRAHAAYAIGRLRFATPGLVLALIGAAADADPRVQVSAHAALAVIAPATAVVLPLGMGLVSDRYSVSRVALAILESAPDATARSAVPLLDAREPLRVRAALAVIHACGTDVDRYAARIARLAEPGHDAFVRRAAARTLGRVSEPDASVLALLARLGDEWDPALRITAAVALGQLALRAPVIARPYAQAIRRIASDELPDLATCLRAAGKPAPEHAPIVERMATARGFLQLDLADALLLPRRSPSGLREIRPRGIELPLRGARLDDAVDNLAESDRPRTAAALLTLCRHGDPAVRAACAVLATELDHGIGTAIVLQTLADNDPDSGVRAVAASLLNAAVNRPR